MNKHDFLALSNIEILWEVIGEQDIFQNRNVFKTALTEFYESENMKHRDLVMLNKAFISSILFASQPQYQTQTQPQTQSQYQTQPQSQYQTQTQSQYQTQQKIPITFEELQTEKLSQFEIKLTEKEEDFKQSMSRPLPQQIPNFRDKMDEPLTEIESIIKRTIAERNYDISQIANTIANTNANTSVNELKSEETSIKKEKLSPLFFSSLNQQKNKSDTTSTSTSTSTPEIKYIKIDNNSFRETPVPIDLNQPTFHSSSDKPSKHISWNKDIQNSDGILFDYTKPTSQPSPTPQPSPPNRIQQMKKIHDDALEVFRRKNADYGDSFATYGIIGILIRIEDKLRRAISINKNGVTLVKDEGLRDTLLDLHNYAAMGLMILDEEI